MPIAQKLLGREALRGQRLALSVSESADLGRLGLAEMHLRLALGEVARCILVAGGTLAYGGHLDATGYTAFLEQELRRYGRREDPLLVCLAWPEHRRIPLSALRKHEEDLGLHGRIVCLNVHGREVDPAAERGEAAQPVDDAEIQAAALAAMRRYMAARTNGRVLIGGRRHGFQGVMPGIIEEALMSVRARHPIYLAGGFGGATGDAVRVLGLAPENWLQPQDGDPPPDPGVATALSELSDACKIGTANGLNRDENCRLATTHRPGEIASLVALGLGRCFRKPSS